MAGVLNKEGFVSEVVFVRDQECLPMLNNLRAVAATGMPHPETVRLMVIPMLYSVWERCFSVWTSICLKVLRESHDRAGDCPPQVRAFWLRKADFFRSFVDTMRDVLELEREDSVFKQASGLKKKITKGGFHLSSRVLRDLDEWHEQPLSQKLDVRELVLTYSNVNDAVVAVNAEAIGLDSVPSYAALDLSRLGGLVGMRNGIGHGATMVAPGPREVAELVDYTERLVLQYADVVLEWIELNTELKGDVAN